MTSLLASIIREDTYTGKHSNSVNHIIDHHRNVLRSKESTYKLKCKKVLKRKLKKYKLRQDGKEDQDIIDVSDTLVSSLFIRSPDKSKDSVELELEELKPKNYLFRMVRRKQPSIRTAKNSKSPVLGKISLEENGVPRVSPDTEMKKQTNAFKLLMDSRNKSIGSNSPGKEKPNDETDMQEFIEKKSIKAKRILMLQKMAEEKGSLKKAEIEEQHEKYIKKKIQKRAEKFKSMIMNNEPKTEKGDKKESLTSQKVRSALDSINTEKDRNILEKPIKTLQLVSIFSETIEQKMITKPKFIPKEDEEFLKKLSPSLRKKQSMLSYFKKVEKESDGSLADSENDSGNVLIKVKLGVKSKKRERKKKLSLNRDTKHASNPLENEMNAIEPDIVEIDNEIVETKGDEIQLNKNTGKPDSDNDSKKRLKRKRTTKESSPCTSSLLSNIDFTPTDDKRPKRTIKRPVKYNDEVDLSSSDEELHIFTPKKTKHSENKNSLEPKSITDQNANGIKKDKDQTMPVKKSVTDKLEKKISKVERTKTVITPKPVKLAPIFTKSQPDPAIEAKQKFLQSGIPEQLKKLIPKQKDSNGLSCNFPIVVHVQQLDATLSEPLKLNIEEEICTEEISIPNSGDFTKVLLSNFKNKLSLSQHQKQISVHNKNKDKTQTILQNLKEVYPRFPVYRTYKLLRGKKKGEFKESQFFSNLDNSIEVLNCSIDMQNDNPEQLTWSDKYKPLSGNEIIGNFNNVKELKKWLVTWTENDTKSKALNSKDSDSSDYYQSEPDSRDSMKSNNNLLILSGPVGSGKTSCVYAVAAELSMKVIEVNASSKRTGKIMLQDLQEATQSHKVNRGTGSNENSQKSQEIVDPVPEIKVKKRGRPKKVVEQAQQNKKLVNKDKPVLSNGPPASQESVRTAMSLILIDDADIVFEQDDGFCSAIMQLVQSSKRPVILIAGSLSLPHLQRFLQFSKVLKMQPLLPKMLGTWLDIMCLADSGTCWPGLGAKFLNYFKGDMRKTINCLQFYVGSQEQVSAIEETPTNSQINDFVKFNTDDENSCMSWAEHDVIEDKNIHDSCGTDLQSVWDIFVNEHTHLKLMKYPLNMFNVWWSLPKILNQEPIIDINKKTDKIKTAKENIKSLELIGNVLESISACDYFSHIQPETEANMTSHPWYDSESNSVSELQNLDCYDRKYETNNELCYELVKSSVLKAQENMGLECRFNFDFPGMSVKRQRDRIVARHTNLTSYLSPQCSLDRKAVALDYWSSCRAICRIEKSRTDAHSKRNNRFCHYLKSLSFLCKTDSFDSLANSLNPNNS